MADRVVKRRPYSIASAPEQTLATGLLEFLVEIDTGGLQGVPADVIRGFMVRNPRAALTGERV